MGRESKIKIVVFFVILIVITGVLMQGSFKGVADNSDYYRVMQPLGFEPAEHTKYFYAESLYTVKTLKGVSFLEGVGNIIVAPVENEQGYSSTQFLIIKMAMMANFTINKILKRAPEVFQIKYLGCIYLLMYAAGITLFISHAKLKTKMQKIIFGVISVTMLCDIGYLTYFNSFFGEALIIVTVVLLVGIGMAYINTESKKKSAIIGIFFFSIAILFVGAKVANTPVGILLAIFSLLLFLLKKDMLNRVIITVGAIMVVASSIYYFSSAPEWMSKVNNYHTLFFGVLKESPTPAEDLKELGIDEKYVVLKDSHAYTDHGEHNIYGDIFKEEVYNKASYMKVLGFYLTHPIRFIEKLVMSAENSVPIRATYLGNYREEEQSIRLVFANRFSLWTNIRALAQGKAFFIIILYVVIFFSINIYTVYKKAKAKDYKAMIFACGALILLASTMAQFVLPVLGNGEADLQKHMLLFTICFDTLLLVGLLWIMQHIPMQKFLYGVIACVLIVGSFYLYNYGKACFIRHEKIEVGDYVQLGIYNDERITWKVIGYEKEKGYLLWAENPVTSQSFDTVDEIYGENTRGRNVWEDAQIRLWLEDEFMDSFTKEEKGSMKEVELDDIVGYGDKEKAEQGNRPHYWSAITPYANQNYESAYKIKSKNTVFLLDIQQLHKYVYKRGEKVRKEKEYWLRTPYYSSLSMVRYVGKDGYVYHRDAKEELAVIPAVYIDENTSFTYGQGSMLKPFRYRE